MPSHPELGKAHISAYGFKKRSNSGLLSKVSPVTGENSNALPGNMVSWCLGGHAVYSPALCSPSILQQCWWDQGRDEMMRLLWVCSPSASASGHCCPPATQLSSPPLQAGARVRNAGLEDQMKSSHLPPCSPGVCCMYKQTERERRGILPGQAGIANKTVQEACLA